MGGKTLKFPKRKKFVHHKDGLAGEVAENKVLSPEEHESRLQKLRDLGLVK